MTTRQIAQLALLVDHLVIGVHRAAGERHGAGLRPLIQTLGLTRPSHVVDVADFFAAGACSPQILRLRSRYGDPAAIERTITELVERELVDGAFRAGDRLGRTAQELLAAQAETAHVLWAGDVGVALDGAASMLAAADGPLVEAYRTLPEPDPAAPRLFRRLTGLRYARMDAHVAAWRRVGFTAPQIVWLTHSVDADGDGPHADDGTKTDLVRRRLIDVDGRATELGRDLRAAIENDTNGRLLDAFSAVPEPDGWLDALTVLSPPPAAPRRTG